MHTDSGRAKVDTSDQRPAPRQKPAESSPRKVIPQAMIAWAVIAAMALLLVLTLRGLM